MGLPLAAAIREPIHLIVVTGFTPPKRSELPLGSSFVPKPYSRHDILRQRRTSHSGNTLSSCSCSSRCEFCLIQEANSLARDETAGGDVSERIAIELFVVLIDIVAEIDGAIAGPPNR